MNGHLADLSKPAHIGTLRILEAAEKAPSVKKVVLCSSLAAITTFDTCFGDDINGVTYNANSRTPDSYYEPIKPAPVEHYFAGKTWALNATDEFVKKGLHFDVINIIPSSVLGRCEIATTPQELMATSNVRALAIAIGKELDPVPTSCVSVDDMAKLHIDVLNMKTGKYHTFGAGIQMSFEEEEAEVIRKHFPDAIEKGIFPMTGKEPDRPVLFDCSATESFSGWIFKPFEDQVKDVAEQHLELVKRS